MVDQGTITVVDGVLVIKDADGTVDVFEFEQDGISAGLAACQALLADTVYDLISDEDAREFVVDLPTGSSAAVLAFEHTWSKPFRDAIVDSGGFLVNDIRLPGEVVDEVLSAVAALN